MLFPTVEFAVFFLLVLTGSWLLMPQRVRWKLFVLAASLVFYGWWDPRFVLLLLGSIVGNQVAAEAIARAATQRGRRLALVGAVTANLAVLAWFKYAGFLVSSVANSLRAIGLDPGLPLLQVVLPVGISFFTFQAISYVVDVWRGDARPAPLLDFAVYLAFFPQIVAGPIVRPAELLPQLRTRRDPRAVDAGRGFALIASGMFKKVVVANLLATSIVDRVFANPGQHSAGEVLIATYGYAVQIYADFSGYTDIAIGCALLMGFTFPDNFDRPYRALSLQDFWRRWHMTLSRWLRDYLYVPLGGNRGGEGSTRRNLLLTMLLGGLWHGAAWTFVVWGGIHGVGLVVERARRSRAAAPRVPSPIGGPPEQDPVPAPQAAAGAPGRRAAVVAWLVTFHVVCLAWVFFRAESIGTAFAMLGRLVVGWGPAPLVTPTVLLVIVGMLALQFLPRTVGLALQARFSRLGPLPQAAALGVALLVIDALGPEGVAPFIYFQF